MKLFEDSQLYKGIFWIVDLDDISNNDEYCFVIPVDSYGDITDYDGLSLNDRNKTTYNHANTWNDLPKHLTHRKSFDYYPRGRVEINNGKAIIYANPNICTDEIKNFIISEFNLTTHNGINEVI